ncbi:MAG: metallophosphoesterase [Patescibacteria group bacterium]
MNIFFDIIIFGLFSITALIAVILLYHTTIDTKSWEFRHKKISTSIIFLLSIIFFLLFWGSFIEPKILVVKTIDIDLPHIDKPIKIALLTDLHVGIYKNDEYLNFIFENIKKQNPDIILIAGDLIDNTNFENEIKQLYPLKTLAEKYPTYIVFGNHEYGVDYSHGKMVRGTSQVEKLKKYFENSKINILQNDLYEITINEQSFYLFGADSFWAGKINYDILEKRDENLDTIALIHNPAVLYTENYPKDFSLALFGHTHGGQIRLPFLGPIGRVDNIIEKKFYKGMNFDVTGNRILVSSGLGESGTRARFFNPPEMLILQIN